MTVALLALELNTWSACIWTAYGIADKDLLQVFVIGNCRDGVSISGR